MLPISVIEPPVATNGSPAVPLPVTVTQSTAICTTGFNGSVLSVSSPVTDWTPLTIGVPAVW